MAIESMQDLRENALDTMRQERNRLFYVALTRPRDGLWLIGGGSWATVVEHCLSKSTLDGKMPAFAHAAGTLTGNDADEKMQLPDWIYQKYEQTNDAQRQDGKSEQTDAMKRGEVIHRLIETLTKTPVDRWDVVITRFKEEGLSAADLQNIHDLTHHSDFIFLFKADRAWSEVELLHNGKLLRIDRLIETNDAFLIVDFKTGEQRTIKAYTEQLAEYKAAIAPMVGAKPVRTYLFWTDALILQEV